MHIRPMSKRDLSMKHSRRVPKLARLDKATEADKHKIPLFGRRPCPTNLSPPEEIVFPSTAGCMAVITTHNRRKRKSHGDAWPPGAAE